MRVPNPADRVRLSTLGLSCSIGDAINQARNAEMINCDQVFRNSSTDDPEKLSTYLERIAASGSILRMLVNGCSISPPSRPDARWLLC